MLACTDSIAPRAQDVLVEIQVALGSQAIAGVVVEVTAPDFAAPLAFNLTVAAGQATGTITVPSGSQRTVTIRAFDALGIETHRGATTINISPSTNPTVLVVLAPLIGNVPIIATVGSYGIVVTPLADTVAVGDTVRLAAQITLAGQPLANARPVWASLNPVLATVDTGGLVHGLLAGTATIVASYGGVAATAAMTITTGAPPPPPPPPPTYPACLVQQEIDLIVLINAQRADSGRAPLAVDTRLVQAARKNNDLVADSGFGSRHVFGAEYGYPNAGPVGVHRGNGFNSAQAFWNALLADTSPLRRQLIAELLSTASTQVGTGFRSAPGIATPQAPYWALVNGGSLSAPVVGSCIP